MIYMSQKGNLFHYDKATRIATTVDGKMYQLSELQVKSCDEIANLDKRNMKTLESEGLLEKFIERRATGEGDLLLLDLMMKEKYNVQKQ